MAALLFREPQFDLIYIDGEHHAASVLEDAILTFPMLKVGGAVVFDDFQWQGSAGILSTTSPKRAVHAFFDVFEDRVRVTHVGYQVHFVKTSTDCGDPRCECHSHK